MMLLVVCEQCKTTVIDLLDTVIKERAVLERISTGHPVMVTMGRAAVAKAEQKTSGEEN